MCASHVHHAQCHKSRYSQSFKTCVPFIPDSKEEYHSTSRSKFYEQHTKVLPNTNTLDWSGSNYSTHSSNYSTHSSNCFNHSSNGMSSCSCALSSRRLYSLLIYGLVLWYTHPSLIMHSCNRGQSHIPLLQRFQVTAHRHHATTTLLLEATETIHCTLTSCWRETLRDT